MRLLSALVLTCLLARPALADTLYVEVPPYWTGTYNKAWVSAVGGPYIRAIMKVGNVVVRDYTFEDLQQHFTLSVTVDSTHFNHGQDVAVQLLAQRIDGAWFDQADTVPVKNKAFAWEHPDFAENMSMHSSEIVQDYLQSMKWSCGENHGSTWGHADVEAQLEGSGVHYVGSHGEPYFHWTSLAWPGPGGTIQDYVAGRDDEKTEQSYYHFRVDQMGNYNASPPPPSPPYNSSGVPQVTFAFIDACASGLHSTFGRILYPIEFTTMCLLTPIQPILRMRSTRRSLRGTAGSLKVEARE